MRLVFAGTPEVALPALWALLDSQHEVVAVVTRPDSMRPGSTATSPRSSTAPSAAAASVSSATAPCAPSPSIFP